MSPDFVRYSPEIENFDPKLSEYMTRLLDYWETKVRESPTRRAVGGPSAAPMRRHSASSGPKSRSRVRCRRPMHKASMRSPAAMTR